MGLMSRISTVVKAKINRLVDDAENPAENLDYAYEKQREMLQNVKRGIVEMVTTKRRLQLQAEKVKSQHRERGEPGAAGNGGGQGRLGPDGAPAQADRAHRTGRAGRTDSPARIGAGEVDPRRAASYGEGGGLPIPEGDNQGAVQRGAGAGEDRIGAVGKSPRRWGTFNSRWSARRTRPLTCEPRRAR